MPTELPLGGDENCCKPVSFHHGLMDLCTGTNGTLLTFPASPALCVCRAWSVNKPVCECGYLGDSTTITFHLFCVRTRFINLCTLSPLRLSCACSPTPVRPRKSTVLGFVCMCLCVSVFISASVHVCVPVCGQKREGKSRWMGLKSIPTRQT